MSWTVGKTWAVGDILTASDVNTHISGRLDWLKGETAWNAPAFVNGWHSVAGWAAPGYRRVGDRVFCRGDVAGGTWGLTIFTVPAAYRSPYNVFFTVISNDSIALAVMYASNDPTNPGSLIPGTAIGGSNAYVFLDNVRWFLL